MNFKSDKKFQRYPSEQLDLVETIGDADKAKKKRLSVFIFLFLTVGISLCFIVYRQFQKVNFRDIKFPKLSLNISDLSKPKFSPVIPANWSLSVQSIGTTTFSYSSNFISQDFVKIKTLHDPSYAKKYLPDGVIVSEKVNVTPDSLEIYSIISTPKIKFHIYAKIPGVISPNSPELDTFSKLAETFYWHLLN